MASLQGPLPQWSGNGLLSFYTGKILHIVGINNPRTVQMIIFAASVATLISPRYPRRTMFLMGTIGAGLVYIVWTNANSKAQTGSPKAVIPVLGSLTYIYLSELFPCHQRPPPYTAMIGRPLAIALAARHFCGDRILEELAFMWEGDAVWNKVRERIDEAMGVQLHEQGPMPEKEDDREPVANERVVNAVIP
ncbi:hypothetical protein GE21DRAFT_1325506 [Neurospora crassa]|nr:hypothetical protein GE21DRAFT_1325506 [Neurospora crassa]